MHKWMFLWDPPAGERIADFGRRALDELQERLHGLKAAERILHLSQERPPRLSTIPFDRQPVALVSVKDEEESQGAEALARLRDLDGELSGYRVNEAQPVPRPGDWPRPGVAPGACLLTVFRRNPRLSPERFRAEWHGRHTPMSLDIHPLQAYVRNTVLEPVTPEAPAWEGIVTENFSSAAHLNNPLKLFGGPLRALPNMIRVGLHISTFMDLKSMRNHLVVEHSLGGRE